jgi:non-canonical (house-cleaning) NTP pyrophosphatase
MKKLKIAVGTTSEQKIGYLQEALASLGVEAEILATEVESGISIQPLTSDETQKGSKNRAEQAFKKYPKADFAIGIEVGYELNKEDDYEMFCWVTILGKNGFETSARSHSFVLPKFHQKILKKNLFLSDYVREYFKVSNDPIIQQVAEDIRGRKPFIMSALRIALIYYFKKEKF